MYHLQVHLIVYLTNLQVDRLEVLLLGQFLVVFSIMTVINSQLQALQNITKHITVNGLRYMIKFYSSKNILPLDVRWD